jgi:hypothetical protein
MSLRFCAWRLFLSLAVAAMFVATSVIAASSEGAAAQNKKPSIKLKAQPPVGFSPMRVVVTAELTGGANDFEDFYCATVEWDWDDGTKSEAKADCDPYEPGKSEIKRRYVGEHTFRANVGDVNPNSSLRAPGTAGGGAVDSQMPQNLQFRVRFTLKQKGKTVGSGQTTVEVRQGVGGD